MRSQSGKIRIPLEESGSRLHAFTYGPLATVLFCSAVSKLQSFTFHLHIAVPPVWFLKFIFLIDLLLWFLAYMMLVVVSAPPYPLWPFSSFVHAGSRCGFIPITQAWHLHLIVKTPSSAAGFTWPAYRTAESTWELMFPYPCLSL